MTYEKEHSYLSRIAEKAKKGIGILTLTALSYAGLDALLETISPSAKSAQAQEQRDKKLDQKVKEYTAAIKDYEAKGDKTNADAQRKFLNQEFLKAPKSLDEYVRALSLAHANGISAETVAVAAENAKPLLIMDSKNKKSNLESLYSMIQLRAVEPGISSQTKLSLLLHKWAYADLLVQTGAEKYRQRLSGTKTELNQVYAAMSPEDRKSAEAVAEAYGQRHLLQKPAVQPKPAPAPEAKPEPKKEEPKKAEPQPAAQPKPQPAVQPKTEPAKIPTIQNPSTRQAQPTSRQPTTRQQKPNPQSPTQDSENAEPSYIEMGTAVDSNQSTKGNTQHASLILEFLDARGRYNFAEWKNLRDEMMTESDVTGYLKMKPLFLTKAGELFGLDVPKSLVDFLTVSAAFDAKKTVRRNFQQTTSEDSLFKIRSDTATNETIYDSFFSAFAAMQLDFLELKGTTHGRVQTNTIKVNNATYITKKSDPAGNHSTNTDIELENILEQQGTQGEIIYKFETLLAPESKEAKMRLSGRAGLIIDQIQSKQKFADGTKTTIDDMWFGVTGKINLADYMIVSGMVMQELLNSPGEKDDGWKDTKAYASLLLNVPFKKIRDIHAKTICTPKFALMVNGWINGKTWGAGAGMATGTGNIRASYPDSMLETIGRTELGLRRDLGDTLEELEVERIMRTMPIEFEDGINAFVYGGARSTRDQENRQRVGGFGHAGAMLGPLSVLGAYNEDLVNRRIGGYVALDFKTLRLIFGFTNELDKNRKHESKTGEAMLEIPLG